MRITQQAEPTAIEKNIAILIAGILAWLTYEIVEKPIRSQKGKQRRRSIVTGLVALSLLMAGISGAVIESGGLPWRYPSTLRPFLTFDYGNSQTYGRPCFTLSNEKGDVWLHLPCMDTKNGADEPLFALWGDSHAAQLEYGLRDLQRTHKFRLAQLTGEGCAPFVSVDNPYQPLCRGKANFFLQQIIQMKPDMVILAAAWYDQGIAPLSETIARLKNAGISRIVVLGPVPRWQGYLPEMLVRAAMLNGNKIPTSFGSDKYYSEPDATLKALTQKAGVQYISAIDALCPAGQCTTVTGAGPQNVLSLDYYHLTNSGSQFLMRRISGQLFSTLQRTK